MVNWKVRLCRLLASTLPPWQDMAEQTRGAAAGVSDGTGDLELGLAVMAAVVRRENFLHHQHHPPSHASHDVAAFAHQLFKASL
eukprot:SAG11_NODE_1687_length_4448_cov_3.035640_3_plen_84_part_00